MRIQCACGGTVKHGYKMEARKRPVNLTLSENLVQQVKSMTDNLSGVVESLPSDFVAQEQRHRLAKAKSLETTIAVWNDFNAKIGSFADEYSSL
jgi:post-segregation antitoxin (ccd killing protein)